MRESGANESHRGRRMQVPGYAPGGRFSGDGLHPVLYRCRSRRYAGMFTHVRTCRRE